MPVPVQKFREVVFQMLYSQDIGRASEDDMLALLMHELSITRKTVRDAQQRVREILDKQVEIDALIAKTSQSYAFERIQTVERNILRLGVFELFFDESIPPKVAISEAMRLSRKFSSPESSAFINAILDTLHKESMGEKIDESYVKESIEKMNESEDISRKAAEEKHRDEQ